MTQIGGTTYTYDANGNLKTKSNGSGVTQYFYDHENRLTSVMLPSSVVINYKYDALGRRVERSKSDGTWTRYSYDGLEVLRDVSSDGSTVEYVNSDELDDHLWQRKSDGTTQYFLTDHQGSTRALADASGAVTASYSYDTFGNGFSGTATRFGYTGREHDAETGLLYYRARWYDPGQGRFVSEDPIGLVGGMNFYGYIGNDPTNWIDPVGLFDKGNFKPKLSTKVKIGRGLGVLGALFLAWEIWDSVNQGRPKPLPRPQATPTPAPTPQPAAGASGAGGKSNCPPGAGDWKFRPEVDVDWRNTNKTLKDALDEAFSRTGVPKDQFVVTRWGLDKYGKSFPVEWQAPGSAEVNIDTGHTKNGPAVPHVGYQTPGKRGNSGCAVRGHIFVDNIPYNR